MARKTTEEDKEEEEEEEEETIKAEALKLKTLADEKYQLSNPKSALKYARRAQRLCPHLNGIDEMITALQILRVVSSKKASDDDDDDDEAPPVDWYRILQVEPFSHINSIKKQYKKLALILHPDKSSCIASEEAFKRVGEAFRVLSDKVKRKEYDLKLRMALQLREAAATTEAAATEKTVGTFWTACSTCRLFHQFERRYVGHSLVCPSCRKSFLAVEVTPVGEAEEDVEVDASRVRTRTSARVSSSQKQKKEKEIERKVSSERVGRGSEKRKISVGDKILESPSPKKPKTRGEMTLAEMQLVVKRKTQEERMKLKDKSEEKDNNVKGRAAGSRNTDLEMLKTEQSDFSDIELSAMKRKAHIEKLKLEGKTQRKDKKEKEQTKAKEKETEKDKSEEKEKEKNWTKGKGKDVGSKGSDLEIITQVDSDSYDIQTRSKRKVHEENMKKNEKDKEENAKAKVRSMSLKSGALESMTPEDSHTCDIETRTKRKVHEENMKKKEKDKKEKAKAKVRSMSLSSGASESTTPEDSHTRGIETRTKRKVHGEKMKTKGKTKNKDKEDNAKAKSRSLCLKSSNLEIMAVDDSDFYDFDKDRTERSFKKGQVWAVYDDDDGMPRHYGLIDEVVSVNPFEVKMSWLDLQSNGDGALNCWGKLDFHTSCGRFKVSRKDSIGSVNIFSHLVECERAAKEIYRIYPKKGSIWAVYNDGVFGGSEGNMLPLDKRYYSIVIFLTSYSEMHGLSMAYLEKVEGFKTIFKRREIGCHAIRWLEKDDIHLFSHQIPARKISGCLHHQLGSVQIILYALRSANGRRALLLQSQN
uniref:J domain-containing protein n=1 Tax=Nelumbo nucifera TaxID=4432 RepID=A0A822YFN3_NELNU|nr:TPA_asm: hypothetical protein HUJ06_031507 [Nelumbo nucifera]